jgi:hypothetical protein
MANVDPKFVRSAKAEADAMRAGITKEYIESRGGVNSSGYYGDSWSSSKNLTPEEYDAVIKDLLAVAVEDLSLLLALGRLPQLHHIQQQMALSLQIKQYLLTIKKCSMRILL